MHSHLLPGIDDGAPDMETSLQLIRGMKNLGFRKLITTPHIINGLHSNTPAGILTKLQEVKEALAEAKIDIVLEAAAEYMVDDYFEQLLDENEALLSFGNNNILIETSTVSAPENLESVIFKLMTKGYKPILAHPERYLYLSPFPDQVNNLKMRGCEFQLNLLSLTGYYGQNVKDFALWLLKNKLIDYLGSDVHHENHINRIQTFLEKGIFAPLLKQSNFQNSIL
ncbi:MAG TPA: hypothetical protein PKA00_12575 [Saprospiraceae bacterium]|nr:hypothetical protein [Saprospiraceae bacterium]HMQ83743.1 hypothetical protein [Saprospiraceae bacterium]